MSSIIRRFSRGSSQRNSQLSQDSRLSTGSQPQQQVASSPTQAQHFTPPLRSSGTPPPQSAGLTGVGAGANTTMMANGAIPGGHGHSNHARAVSAGAADGSRPLSAESNSSFDFLNQPPQPTQQQPNQRAVSQPMSQPVAGSAIGNLSRTDQIVLKHFWDEKFAENAKRDLHFLKFPFFGQYPSHRELMPYCEIYHLVKTSPGANIISLGSASGVYIGFELSQGAQLHIDMDDEWQNISHHRVAFKPYESMVRNPNSDATFKSWPKPLTIEFLEEQYKKWLLDLTSFCWTDESVRELGPTTASQTVGM